METIGKERSVSTDAVPGHISQSALEYASWGWHVVPLMPRDKRPRLNAWQNNASADEETVAGWFDQWPDSNVGVKLGQDSGLVDVECDDEEAETTLLRLFDGSIPNTPTFAASRGKHRLFKWRNDLPHRDKAVFKIAKLEFRTGNGNKGAQSVFPPSLHPSGTPYRWLVHPDDAKIATFPPAVLVKLHNLAGEDSIDEGRPRRPQEHWDRIVEGVAEGCRNEDAASLIGRMLASLVDPFDNDAITFQWDLLTAWNDRNKPPIDSSELKRTFGSILTRERRRRTDQDYREEFSKEARPRIGAEGQVEADGWKLIIRDTKPRTYCLQSPLWHGTVDLTSSDMLSADAIRRKALEQKDVWVSKPFNRLWQGTKDTPSLGRQLVESAEHAQAPAEQHRDRVVAGLLLDQLRKAKAIPDGGSPDPRGNPQIMEDGSVIFIFGYVWKELAYSPDKVSRTELAGTLEATGVAWYQPNQVRGGRFKRLSKESMTKLEHLASPDRLQNETGG